MRNFCLSWSFVLVFLTISPLKSNAVVTEKLLNQANLATVWQSAIALNPAGQTSPQEKVQRITVLGDYLYILTDGNYLFCLNRNTGQLQFGDSVATPRLPVSEPADYNNIAYIIAANKLVAIDPKQGTMLYSKKIPFLVSSAAAAANSSYFYFAGADRLLHIANLKDVREVFKASADKVSDVTSVIATDSFVFFATDGGDVICMTAGGPKKKWQMNADGAITAPLVKNGGWIYTSSKDTNLYKLDAKNGKMKWKFRAGSALLTSARAAENAVYQYAQGKGLYAVDANSGKQLWLLAEGVDLLAQDGNTAYVFDKNNMCIAMDNKEAKKIYTINFASVTSFASNVYDSSIYIMEDKNISCVKPIRK